jgi:hypothetical protein
MTEMVCFTIIARPLYFVCEHAVHVRYDFYRHIYEALAEDKAKV